MTKNGPTDLKVSNPGEKRWNRKDEASHHGSSLVHWKEVPHWQQDNQHILGSYRRPSGSYTRSFASLLYIHNESVNIYTHLIPALASIPGAYILYRLSQPRYARATSSDVIAFTCFFIGAALCLGMSATYHTISNHSPRVNKLGNQLDYVGIVLLITGSFVPSVYYGFWCDPCLQRIYWTMVGLMQSYGNIELKVADMLFWSWLHCRFSDAEVPDSNLETFSSWDVCFDGTFCSLSSAAWFETVRSSADEKADWTFVASPTRCTVYIGSWYLCGISHRSPLMSFP
jgi:predicted membrane channel-forming protein YqfA (hemolysin III family)